MTDFTKIREMAEDVKIAQSMAQASNAIWHDTETLARMIYTPLPNICLALVDIVEAQHAVELTRYTREEWARTYSELEAARDRLEVAWDRLAKIVEDATMNQSQPGRGPNSNAYTAAPSGGGSIEGAPTATIPLAEHNDLARALYRLRCAMQARYPWCVDGMSVVEIVDLAARLMRETGGEA